VKGQTYDSVEKALLSRIAIDYKKWEREDKGVNGNDSSWVDIKIPDMAISLSTKHIHWQHV